MEIYNLSIELLSKEEYEELLAIQKNFPVLTFQNDGYQYIKRSVFTEEENAADKRVTEILAKHIKHFKEFNNFKLRSNGDIVVRCQTMWSESFTGVTYVTIRELYNGFNNLKEKSL